MAEWNNGQPLGLRTVHAYVLVFDMGNLSTFQVRDFQYCELWIVGTDLLPLLAGNKRMSSKLVDFWLPARSINAILNQNVEICKYANCIGKCCEFACFICYHHSDDIPPLSDIQLIWFYLSTIIRYRHRSCASEEEERDHISFKHILFKIN